MGSPALTRLVQYNNRKKPSNFTKNHKNPSKSQYFAILDFENVSDDLTSVLVGVIKDEVSVWLNLIHSQFVFTYLFY